jgi:hypothetical protein
MSGHPPFGAQIILNGHEYVARGACRNGVEFRKEGNCFIDSSDGTKLGQIADTLLSAETEGRLRQLCDRWIYSACLIFALDSEEQQRSGFRYEYSSFQLEYSRNLRFKNGAKMYQVMQSLIDRTRGALNLKTVKTIFGFKKRPTIKRLKQNRWGVEVENPAYDLTVFHIHYGKVSLKMYTKGECLLRSEVMVHNTAAVPFRRSLAAFPKIAAWMRDVLERFLNTLHCLDACFIADDMLEQLPEPTVVGKTRVGGVEFNKPRIRWAVQGILSLSTNPKGFTAGDLAAAVREIGGRKAQGYSSRNASYDLKKFRGKHIIEKKLHSNRYKFMADGLRALAAAVLLRDKVIRPLLMCHGALRRGRKPKNRAPIDRHYDVLQHQMRNLFQELGIAA